MSAFVHSFKNIDFILFYDRPFPHAGVLRCFEGFSIMVLRLVQNAL